MEGISISGSTSYCKLCNLTLTNESRLKRHLLTAKHKNGGILPTFRCKICSKQVGNGGSASKHLKDVHKKKLRSSYKCEKCSSTFKYKSELIMHSVVHMHKARKYCCPFCKEFFAENDFMAHIRVHVNKKPFLSLKSGKSFHLRNQLINHRCPTTFPGGSTTPTTSVQRLVSQSRIGSEVRNRNASRTDHPSIVQRIEMKPFSCDLCDKSFRLRIMLATHRCRTHPVQELEDESVATSANSEPNICPANRSTSSSQSGSAAQEATARVDVLQAIQTQIAAEEKVIEVKLREATQLEGQIKWQKMITEKVSELTGTNQMISGTGQTSQVDALTAEYIGLRIDAEKGAIATKEKNLETLRQEIQSLQLKVEAWRLLLE